MTAYPYVYKSKAIPERFNQRCRLAGKRGDTTALVEFEDGAKVIVSRWALRRAT